MTEIISGEYGLGWARRQVIITTLLSERYGLTTAVRGILSNAVKKYRLQFLIGRTIFLTREKRRSLFLLAGTYFRTKIYIMAF